MSSYFSVLSTAISHRDPLIVILEPCGSAGMRVCPTLFAARQSVVTGDNYPMMEVERVALAIIEINGSRKK